MGRDQRVHSGDLALVFIKLWSGKASWRRERDKHDILLDGTYPRKSVVAGCRSRQWAAPQSPGTRKGQGLGEQGHWGYPSLPDPP